jgi:hypothetical protein
MTQLTELIKAAQKSPGRVPFNGAGFYSENSNNRYAIYSAGIDRFLLLDKQDLWITFETAKILSAKLPSAVFAFSDDVPNFDNDEALFWSITNKNLWMSENQTPSLIKLSGPDSIAYEGAPIDYVSEDQLDMVVKVQNYALFTQKILYACSIAHAMCNPDDQGYFAHLMSPLVAKRLEHRTDQSRFPEGFLMWTKRALYQSDSIVDALEKINKIWSTNSYRDEPFKKLFFSMAELKEPETIQSQVKF